MASVDAVWIMAAAAGIQAIMATLLWLQGRTLSQAATHQAAAAVGTHNLVVEGTLTSSANGVKEALKKNGYNGEAWEIERALFDYVSKIREDPEAIEALEPLRDAMLAGLHTLLRNEQAARIGIKAE